jgi:hypothetical protein
VSLDRERYTPGDTIRGTILVAEGGGSRSLEIYLNYIEKTDDYSAVASSISSGPIHDGDLTSGMSFTFELPLPAEALPNFQSEHGRLFWQVDVKSDEFGRDSHERHDIDVTTAPRTPPPSMAIPASPGGGHEAMTNYQQMPPPPPPTDQPSSHRLRTAAKWAAVIAVSFGFGACIGAVGASSSDDTSSPSAAETVTVTQGTGGASVSGNTPSQDTSTVTTGGDNLGGKLPLTDGGWRLDKIQVKGSFGGTIATGRVTYLGAHKNAFNIFTVTLFKHGKVVGSLDGYADGVQPGDAVTVDFYGVDRYVGGPFKFDFRSGL